MVGWSLFFSGCSDIFEKDISDDILTIYTPHHNDTLSEGIVNFWWEELDEAESYRIIIIGGTFENPDFLITDSILEQTIFSTPISVGNYSWRLTAQNASSETQFFQRSFVVDTNTSLSNVRISIESPEGGKCINDSTVYVSWTETGIGSVRYQVDVRSGSFEQGATIASFETVNGSIELSHEAVLEGLISIGVRAVNDVNASPFSVVEFSVDVTNPVQLSLLTPADGDTIFSGDVNFAWDGAFDESGCSELDSMEIYTDENLSNLYQGIGNISESQSTEVELPNGRYWYRVLRIDEAGNTGSYSQVRMFDVYE